MRKKYALSGVYRGKTISFVDKTEAELTQELNRIRQSVREAKRILDRNHRHKHPVLTCARTQLNIAVGYIDESVPDSADKVAHEVVRLSFILMDTEHILNRLCHYRSPFIEGVRTVLRYGGAHVKKDEGRERQIVN